MQFLPTCNEGFRRLSVAATTLACLMVFGIAILASTANRDSIKYTCSPDVVTDTTYDCKGLDVYACKAARTENLNTCIASHSWSPTTYLLWAFGVATAGYIATLIVRSLGWIVQGFIKPRG